MGDVTFTVTTNAERKADMERVFGSATVPIRSPIPTAGSAPGIERALFYELDVDALAPDQLERALAHLRARFSMSEEEARAALAEHGIPILAEDGHVMIRNPLRWLG